MFILDFHFNLSTRKLIKKKTNLIRAYRVLTYPFKVSGNFCYIFAACLATEKYVSSPTMDETPTLE